MTFDDIAASLRSGRDRVTILLDGLSDDDANRKPSPVAWSAVEVVHHLNRLAADYLPPLERAYAAAPAADASGEQAFGWAGSRFVRAVGPSGASRKTFGTMAPPASEAAASALDVAAERATFEADMARFVALADRAGHTATVRIGLPLLPIVRLRGAAVLAGLAGHVHRHAAQMERRLAAGPLTSDRPAEGPR